MSPTTVECNSISWTLTQCSTTTSAAKKLSGVEFFLLSIQGSKIGHQFKPSKSVPVSEKCVLGMPQPVPGREIEPTCRNSSVLINESRELINSITTCREPGIVCESQR